MVPGISSRTRLINSKGQIKKLGGKMYRIYFCWIMQQNVCLWTY